MIQGYLKGLVLRLLSHHEMSGYDLMKNLGTDLGKKPSPGSMYPLLDSLIKEELATVKEVGRRKVYKITKKGKAEFKGMVVKKQEFCSRISALVKEIMPKEDYSTFMIGSWKKIMDIYKIPGLIEMKKLFVKLVKEDRIKKNEKELEIIFKEMNERLKKLK